MTAPESILKLVEKYTFHREAYLRGQEKFNEQQLRAGLSRSFFPCARMGREQ